MDYSAECVEGSFSEVGLYGVLRESEHKEKGQSVIALTLLTFLHSAASIHARSVSTS